MATDNDRALRNLREDITNARGQLDQWRRDGNADQIAFWARRLDALLDRYPRKAPEKVTAP